MKRFFLYTFLAGLSVAELSSCDALLSASGGYGGVSVGATPASYEYGYGIGYDEARRQALFLSDKMAYELGLTDAQYEAVYEINLDYLLNMQGESSLYGSYWNRRNADLSYVLSLSQYNYFINEDYFYRPVYWYNNGYAFGVYDRYDTNRYYRGRPEHYWTYKGGRNRGTDSYYRGKFGNQTQRPNITRNTNNDWNVTHSSTWQTGRLPSQQSNINKGQHSFGNQQRNKAFNDKFSQRENSSNNSTVTYRNEQKVNQQSAQSFGALRRETMRQSQQTQPVQQRPTAQQQRPVMERQRASAQQPSSFGSRQSTSFGSASSRFGGSRSLPQSSTPVQQQPSTSSPAPRFGTQSTTGGHFGGHR